jgi:hypothetical protein
MTQPHPFKDLPEGVVVKAEKRFGDWCVRTPCCHQISVERQLSSYSASIVVRRDKYHSPDAAFQALRQAVRDLANDLGAV